ncbi:phosphoglycerate kinase [Candidatus Uhrbacteria bacterium]|nr:phosphoglycerate kinase [Candidatus Uhrbacteria bacterium]
MPIPIVSRLKHPAGRRVLMRVDFNVPLDGGRIADDERIKAAVTTIERLAAHGAKVILVSHLGQPDGWDRKFTLAPVAVRLSEILRRPVRFVSARLDDDEKVARALEDMDDGDIALLENIRFYKGEEKNDVFLSRRLAALADAYVNDAFGAAHRAHASTAGVAALLPSFAGYLMERELRNLGRVLEKPKSPFIALIGGAKVSTKLPAIEKLLTLADKMLLGGGLANNFLKAKGYEVGKSLVGPAEVKLAKRLLGKRGLVLPVDVVAATALSEKTELRVCAASDVRRHEYIVDIGPTTVRAYAAELKKAKMIVWNGPVGLYEITRFRHGSVALGRVIAARSLGRAYGVVGGGETIACLQLTGMAEYVDHVSTGGGAMLEFLSGKKLPAVAALEKAKLTHR